MSLGAAKDGGMEPRGREEEEFAIVRKVNNVYPTELKAMTPRLAVWIDNGRSTEPTHQRSWNVSKGVIMTTTAKEGKGTEAALMTLYRRQY